MGLRAVKFDSGGELRRFDVYGVLLSKKQIDSGVYELELNTKARDYYVFNDIKFLVVAGDTQINFNELKTAPRICDISPYINPCNDRNYEFSIDINFEINLDKFMLRRPEIYDKAEVKGFECFFRAMDKSQSKRLFCIKECEWLDKFYADKVRNNREERLKNAKTDRA